METTPLCSFGEVKEERGKIVKGKFPLISTPIGIQVNLDVIIASGEKQGPTVIITANIHGDEVNGVVVIHRFLESLQLDKLCGRIIIIPSLNPTGHLVLHRKPIFDPEKDPNRAWPEFLPTNPRKVEDSLSAKIENNFYNEPGPQERAFKLVAEQFKAIKPDYFLDLHTFSTLSIPISFLDRVFYFEDTEEEKKKAEQLFQTSKELVEFMGITVILERPAWLYIKEKLHRSTSGYVLNHMRIPSVTLELGPMNVAYPSSTKAGFKALHNFLIFAKMMEGERQQITETPVISFPTLHRYFNYPQVSHTGIVDFQFEPGQKFVKGDILAIVRSINGEVIEKITSEFDGAVIGWWDGVAKYAGQFIGAVAIEDDNEKVVKWSEVNLPQTNNLAQ